MEFIRQVCFSGLCKKIEMGQDSQDLQVSPMRISFILMFLQIRESMFNLLILSERDFLHNPLPFRGIRAAFILVQRGMNVAELYGRLFLQTQNLPLQCLKKLHLLPRRQIPE